MTINTSIRILFQLASHIKRVSETNNLILKNKDMLKQIYYEDDFFNRLTFPIHMSGICEDYLILLSCSFLDEFEKQFTPTRFPENRKEILELKRITLPAYKRIKKWKDLNKMRNHIIAHNLRINGNSIFNSPNRVKYNIPSTNTEFALLANLIFLIAKNITPLFSSIVADIDFRITLRDCISLHSEKINSVELYNLIEQEVNNNKVKL